MIALVSTGNIEASCNATCDSDALEFCGSDGFCHNYSCENWYEFGNVRSNTTGYYQSLVCNDISIDEGSYEYNIAFGVYFGCNITFSLRQSFTRECVAYLDEYSTFRCHEMGESTDFQSFLDGNENNTLACKADPKYMYVNWIGSNNYLGTDSVSLLSMSSEFNQTLAERTMYAYLTSNETFGGSPPTTTPKENPSEPLQVPNVIVIIAVIAVSSVVFALLTLLQR